MDPKLAICSGYDLNLADYSRTGLRVGIWASSGRGKSFGVGVFCEELLSSGIPVIAIDPEGELHTLREQFRVLVLGGEYGDLPLPPGPTGIKMALARTLDEGLGLVIDLSEKPSSRSQQKAAQPWLEELWILLSERRIPAALVVEEVHLFAPQSGSAITADIMQRFAKQGRKRGAILVAASQRTQAVSKEFMSQLNFPAIGGFETERDYEAVRAVVNGHTFEEFRSLSPGQFYLTEAAEFYRWRPRHTSHGGDAPDWSAADVPPPSPRDSALADLVEQLKTAFAEEQELSPDTEEASAERIRIRELERDLSTAKTALSAAQANAEVLQEEVNRLKVALQVLGVIKVVITQEVVANGPAAVAVPGVPAGVGQAVPPPATVSAAPAVPASPLKDARIAPEAILSLEEVKSMIRRAGDRARRRYSGAGEWTRLVAKSLVSGSVVAPVEFAGRYGYHGKVTVKRVEAAMEALATVGFAVFKNGGYRLNEHYLYQLIIHR